MDEMDEVQEQDWPDKLPAVFYKALSEFNRYEYYTCHETLEALWIPEKRSFRALYQGILQIAVGCYHLTTRANWTGAVNLLDAGARRLEREIDSLCYVDSGMAGKDRLIDGNGAYNVDWQSLIADADRLQQHLRLLGRDRVAEYLPALLPQIRYFDKTYKGDAKGTR